MKPLTGRGWPGIWALAVILAIGLTGCQPKIYPSMPPPPPPPAPAPPPVVSRPVFYVNATRLNLRACPGMDCPKISVLERNEAVEKVGESEDWAQVRVKRDGRLGWVNTRYLASEPVQVAPEAPAPTPPAAPIVTPPPLPEKPAPTAPPVAKPPEAEKPKPAKAPEQPMPPAKKKAEEKKPSKPTPAEAAEPPARKPTPAAEKPTPAAEKPAPPTEKPASPAEPTPAPGQEPQKRIRIM